jgi:hypothetical protein
VRTRFILPAVFLLVSCNQTARLYVDHPPSVDGAWQIGEGARAVAVDATDNTLTIVFRGRRFRFPGVGAFRGSISPKAVSLRGDFAIDLDDTALVIDRKKTQLRRTLAELPADRTVVYTNGALLFE